jgi:drug/metabolite transporter (DMT)-like permease
MGSSKWIGNVLSIAAAVAYAVANVLQEMLVQTATATTFLCRFSMCMAPVSIVIGGVIEWKEIAGYNWDGKAIGFVIAYAVLLASFYTGVPNLLQWSSAMEMNISLLTSNFFSLAVSIVAFGERADWLYLVGFCCVPVAIALFTTFPSKQPGAEAPPEAMLEPMLPDHEMPEPDVDPPVCLLEQTPDS